MYLGIDVGTSSVKVALLDDEDELVAEGSAGLDVQRPHPSWSEQNPDDWWRATNEAVRKLCAESPDGLAGIRAVGLSGQMHGATLLDKGNQPLRPAILWNDGRSAAECVELERLVPESRAITGNLAMPGFTAPKLLWVREHEPDVYAKTRRVLLPKDYVRMCMTGEFATDLSDASGTLWVDVGERCWSEPMLDACGLGVDAMPSLHEGPEETGQLREDVAQRWGCRRVPVVAGGGDNAAGAVGAGVVEPGRAFLSLGTSGVYFVAGDAFRPDPGRAVHAFCHALPGQWHQMSVLLSAASCLAWVTALTHARDESALLREIETDADASGQLLFLPYLSGERTPHNDPTARGVFVGLDHDTGRAQLGRAVLEGVAFAFADAQRVLFDSGSRIDSVSVIGGGARSQLWGRILASALGRPLVYRRGGEVGPARGAARLARLGTSQDSLSECCAEGPVDFIAQPEPSLVARYAERIERFRGVYSALKETFRADATTTEEK